MTVQFGNKAKKKVKMVEIFGISQGMTNIVQNEVHGQGDWRQTDKTNYNINIINHTAKSIVN